MKRNLLRFYVIGEVGDKEQEITLSDITEALSKGGMEVQPMFSQGNPPYLFVSKKRLTEVLHAEITKVDFTKNSEEGKD